MKRIRFIFGAKTAVFGLMFLVGTILVLEFTSCGPSEENFYGEIPVGFQSEMRWENMGSYYEPIFSINVIVNSNDGLDTIKAVFNPHALQGGFMVIYRDSYPPTHNQPVFVRGYYQNGQAHIAEAYSQKPEDYQ